MKGFRQLFLGCFLLLALSCGRGKTAAPQGKATRDFPLPKIPVMMTDQAEQTEWLCQHFWDSFTAPDSLYYCDSVTVNGVPSESVEKMVGTFATLLPTLPLPDAVQAMQNCYQRLAAFQQAHPDGNVFPATVELLSRYFYDPNSPVRNEELYLPFVSLLAESPLVSDSMRPAYAWDAKNCSLNRIGTVAADFSFIDSAGGRRNLHGIRADWLLLIFGNPDCNACRELQAQLEGYPQLATMIADGRLKVVDIYIDEDIDAWKAKVPEYPALWINGYDPSYQIRTDRVYSVRAIPSLYLLDAGKRVVLKDAPVEQVLAYLLNN